jgi:ParB family chromosome partitioning protein
VMGNIDLDPASCEFANRTVGADRIYTIDDDGMAQPWAGCLWLNPPYGRDEGQLDSNQARWSRRLIDEYRAGNVREAVLLVNAVPGNRWFAPLWDFPICFVSRRIRFYNEETEAGQPTHSNVLVYLGPAIERFVQAFSKFGPVAARLRSDGDDLHIDL